MGVYKIKGKRVSIACSCGNRFDADLSELGYRRGSIILPTCSKDGCEKRNNLFLYELPEDEEERRHIPAETLGRTKFHQRILKKMVDSGAIDASALEEGEREVLTRDAVKPDGSDEYEFPIHSAFKTKAEIEDERRVREEKRARKAEEKARKAEEERTRKAEEKARKAKEKKGSVQPEDDIDPEEG